MQGPFLLTGSSLIAAFALATIAMAQNAPIIAVRMLTSWRFEATPELSTRGVVDIT